MVLWFLLLFLMIKWDIKKLRFIKGGLELWHIGLVPNFLLFIASCLYIIKIKIKIKIRYQWNMSWSRRPRAKHGVPCNPHNGITHVNSLIIKQIFVGHGVLGSRTSVFGYKYRISIFSRNRNPSRNLFYEFLSLAALIIFHLCIF